MKRPETDPERVTAEIASKDKQTLVLFLLGWFIIFLPIFSMERKETMLVYGIAPLTGTERWQIVSLAENMAGQECLPGKADLVSRQMHQLSNFSEKNSSARIPAELALFLNRPLPINRSRQEDIEMLPGIGPHLAALINDGLKKKGRFTGSEDLLEIPGIGPKNLQRILPLVSFEE